MSKVSRGEVIKFLNQRYKSRRVLTREEKILKYLNDNFKSKHDKERPANED